MKTVAGETVRTTFAKISVAALLACSPLLTRAGVFDWASTADGNWSDNASWTGAVAPVSDADNVIQFFTAAGNALYTATNDLGTVQLNQLAGGNGAAVTGGTLDFAQSTGLVNPTLIHNGTTTFGIGSAVNLSADTTVSGTGPVAINGNISGTGGLKSTGPGMLTVTGNNTYSGGTIVTSGTFRVNNTAGSGTGSGSVTVNFGGVLTGTGTIDGPVRLNNNGVMGGSVTINNDASVTRGSFGGTGTVTGNVTLNDRGTLVGSVTILGSAIVTNGGVIQGAGTIANVILNNGGALSGNPKMGQLTVNQGGLLTPGASGSASNVVTGNAFWNGGGQYLWTFNNFVGTQGGSVGWDWIDIGGVLDLSSASLLNPFVIKLNGGSPTYFSNQFVIASAAGGILNYDTGDIKIDSSLIHGKWTIDVGNSGRDLILTFTVPEPSTIVMFVVGGLLMLGSRMRQWLLSETQ